MVSPDEASGAAAMVTDGKLCPHDLEASPSVGTAVPSELDDIDTDFGTRASATPPQASTPDAANAYEPARGTTDIMASASDDSQRRETGAPAGPSHSSEADASNSEDDLPLFPTFANGRNKPPQPVDGSEMVQLPNGLARIRVSGTARGAAAAASPTAGPATPSAAAAAAARPAAAAAANGRALPGGGAPADTPEASSSDEEEGSPAAGGAGNGVRSGRKKRRNLLPSVRKSERCGHCHTCLHPKARAALAAAEQRQITDLVMCSDCVMGVAQAGACLTGCSSNNARHHEDLRLND